MLLVDKEKVSDILQLSIGVNKSEFEKYIQEAQDFDLRNELKNDELFLALIDDDDSKFDLNAIRKTKRFECGKVYNFHNGIDVALCYLSYARYVYKGNFLSTPYGMHKKLNNQSEEITKEDKENLYYHYRGLGLSVLSDVKNYMFQAGYYKNHLAAKKKTVSRITTIK